MADAKAVFLAKLRLNHGDSPRSLWHPDTTQEPCLAAYKHLAI